MQIKLTDKEKNIIISLIDITMFAGKHTETISQLKKDIKNGNPITGKYETLLDVILLPYYETLSKVCQAKEKFMPISKKD